MKNIVIQEMTNKLYIDSVDSTKRLISAAFSFVLPVAQCNKFVKIGETHKNNTIFCICFCYVSLDFCPFLCYNILEEIVPNRKERHKWQEI